MVRCRLPKILVEYPVWSLLYTASSPGELSHPEVLLRKKNLPAQSAEPEEKNCRRRIIRKPKLILEPCSKGTTMKKSSYKASYRVVNVTTLMKIFLAQFCPYGASEDF